MSQYGIKSVIGRSNFNATSFCSDLFKSKICHFGNLVITRIIVISSSTYCIDIYFILINLKLLIFIGCDKINAKKIMLNSYLGIQYKHLLLNCDWGYTFAQR